MTSPGRTHGICSVSIRAPPVASFTYTTLTTYRNVVEVVKSAIATGAAVTPAVTTPRTRIRRLTSPADE